jgi:hypothetical protein
MKNEEIQRDRFIVDNIKESRPYEKHTSGKHGN